jgi:hypothetical protein
MDKELLDNDDLDLREQQKPYLLLVSSIVLVVGFLICDLIAYNNVRTVIYSGPFLGFVSVLVIVASLMVQNKRGILFGSVALLMVIVLFLVIYFLEISPREAQGLLPPIAFVCWIPILVLGILLWIDAKKAWGGA